MQIESAATSPRFRPIRRGVNRPQSALVQRLHGLRLAAPISSAPQAKGLPLWQSCLCFAALFFRRISRRYRHAGSFQTSMRKNRIRSVAVTHTHHALHITPSAEDIGLRPPVRLRQDSAPSLSCELLLESADAAAQTEQWVPAWIKEHWHVDGCVIAATRWSQKQPLSALLKAVSILLARAGRVEKHAWCSPRLWLPGPARLRYRSPPDRKFTSCHISKLVDRRLGDVITAGPAKAAAGTRRLPFCSGRKAVSAPHCASRAKAKDDQNARRRKPELTLSGELSVLRLYARGLGTYQWFNPLEKYNGGFWTDGRLTRTAT